ncbi:Na+/H+ antiporter NhaA [Psychromonas ossibalaenae]|uniref:Na+/H+ antiporter NhaA n=1 Tax=Psychromonas ossibalaenae TaxID=444922 RepID=UPI00037D667F|nr:Na+/H+ antiporter NhaA [Psychromonas ossibalaenae]
MFESIRRFVKNEASSGLILMAAAVLALIAANSPWQHIYEVLINLKLTVAVEQLAISKPLLLWINDGLMAVFFLLVGLELKREAIEGELNTPKKVILPALGALGGMVFPALIYTSMNIQDDIAIQGWAIPTATDIAFSLGILILLGKYVPSSLKIFLVSLALFDDLGAIIIIALFYTEHLSLGALLISSACIVLLWAMNKGQVVSKAAYLMVGVVMWGSLLQSGVHATLAGVILALFIPMRGVDWDANKMQPLHELEQDLHAPVGLIVLPLFAFVNAGLSFSQLNLSDVFQNIPLGIILGLFVGKQAGVMLTVWLGIKLNLGAMPKNVGWSHMYGIAVLCGVGFTMSLFIGGLAFEQSGDDRVMQHRLGILLGSLLSAVWAVIWLRYFCSRDNKNEEDEI